MAETNDIVFIFDVDNTLLDNDALKASLRRELIALFGEAGNEKYWAHYEALRKEEGFVDLLGAVQRFRLEYMHDRKVYQLSRFLLDYPFPDRLFPGALEAVSHVRRWGLPIIVSDGDMVFQPRKIANSGLWRAFDDQVLIYIHKQQELDEVERLYPARHYVLFDDNPKILDGAKKVLGDRVTTVLPKQGHYANDAKTLASFIAPDIAVDRIADVTTIDFSKIPAISN